MKLEALKKYWRSCKRKKTAFNDEVAEEKVLFSRNSILHEYEMELIKRVKILWNNATTEGIHTLYADRMRKKLYDEMVENGWNKYWAANWCFSDRAVQVVFSEVEGDDTLGPWY